MPRGRALILSLRSNKTLETRKQRYGSSRACYAALEQQRIVPSGFVFVCRHQTMQLASLLCNARYQALSKFVVVNANALIGAASDKEEKVTRDVNHPQYVTCHGVASASLSTTAVEGGGGENEEKQILHKTVLRRSLKPGKSYGVTCSPSLSLLLAAGRHCQCSLCASVDLRNATAVPSLCLPISSPLLLLFFLYAAHALGLLPRRPSSESSSILPPVTQSGRPIKAR